ncbi:serine/threonine-protein kinase [Streptomyces sp. NBC_00370]|uniref:serine/threonine-protein kinase n=2 Tax=unclassified Streptomyces TaxID=2593676 RepID=UPI002E275210
MHVDDDGPRGRAGTTAPRLLAGRYRMLSRLGRGGMGEVWRAVDEVLGRPVAVKLLLNRQADEAAVARFHLEAQTAARLSDPHVVAVYDTGTDADRQYLVTELLEGRSLADEISEHGPLPSWRTARIGGQVAEGLAAAHRQGVVHRDVKPGNLLLNSDDTVKIGDFGIARFADESSAGLTTTGQIIGTSAYLSPERALGRPAGPPADMYALGCVLYELLSGHTPFQADTPTAMVYQHVDVAPDPPGRYHSDLPEAFDEFVLRLLAKDSEERPTARQAAGFLAAPDRWAARRPAHRATRALPAAVPPSTEAAPAPARPPVRRWRARRAHAVIGTVLAAVATVSVVGLTAVTSGDGNGAAPESGGGTSTAPRTPGSAEHRPPPAAATEKARPAPPAPAEAGTSARPAARSSAARSASPDEKTTSAAETSPAAERPTKKTTPPAPTTPPAQPSPTTTPPQSPTAPTTPPATEPADPPEGDTPDA